MVAAVSASSSTKPKIPKNKLTKAQLKKQIKIVQKLFAQNTKEFCKNTTLHGLNYLANEDLYLIERVFFALAFVFVVLLSGFFISKIYDKWNMTPVLFGVNPEPTYVVREPFPAVTICNLNMASKSKVQKYSTYSTEYAMLQMLCKREVNVTIADSIKDWNNLSNFITEISQPCSSMVLACHFGAEKFNCSEFFHPEVTEEGLCCVFNMVHPSFRFRKEPRLVKDAPDADGYVPVYWSTERGYVGKLPKKFYPRKAAGTGESLGLSLALDVEADNYYCSSMNSVGFKILLHNPTESASIRENGLLLAPGRETKMRIRAEKIESDQHLRSLSRRARQCLFQDEEKLQMFRHYTQRNCEVECLAHNLIKSCGCLSHYMPKLHGNESICSIYDASCVEHVRLRSMFDLNGRDCQDACMPSCYDLTFLPDFFSTPLSHSGFQIVNQVVKNMSSEYVERSIAIVNMYFKENIYRSAKQTEFIGMTDFLSSVGGLIGLFCGFSFISLAEFVFYALIRPCRALRQVEIEEERITRARRNTFKYKIQRIRNRFRNPFGTYMSHIHSSPPPVYMRHELTRSVSDISSQFDESIDDRYWYTRKRNFI